MKHFIIRLFAILSIGSLSAQNPNDVIINEYNDNGGASGIKNGIDMTLEWVELLVVKGPVDLRNWYITDEEWTELTTTSAEGKLQLADSPAFSSVATGTYVVIVKGNGTDDTNAADGNLVLYTGNANVASHYTFSLALGGDGIALIADDDQTAGEKDAGEIPVDYVSWGSVRDVPTGLTWDNAITGTEDEDSYFSNGSNFNNDAAADWVTNAENGGSLDNRTPGAANPGQNDNSLPVDLAHLSGYSHRGTIILEWATECEVNNLGFILERKPVGETGVSWRLIADYRTNPALRGQGSTSQRHEYQFQDLDVAPGKEYGYRLKDVDMNGRMRTTARITVKAREPVVTVGPPRPNPFNPVTRIPLEVGTAGPVRIAVLDLLGREIRVLTDGYLPAGNYYFIWDGTNTGNRPVSGGVYFLTVRGNDVSKPERYKLILLR
ncbi:MAG: hypothetical protein ACE5D1_00805 [Fidelibacterota bacterium]